MVKLISCLALIGFLALFSALVQSTLAKVEEVDTVNTLSGEMSTALSHPRFRERRQDDEDEFDTKEMLRESKRKFEEMKKGAKEIVDFGQSASKLLLKLGTIMQGFGPTMAAVGMIISLLTAFLPEQDSAELTYMKEQFAITNNKLDHMTSRLDDIDMQIEYQGAKVSFGPYSRKISSLMRQLNFVLEAPNDRTRDSNKDFFVQTFVKTYDDSAFTLYNAMMGEESTFFGYDLLDVTARNTKCNIQKITQFCVITGKLIRDAITTEGAYFGFKNMTYRVHSEGKKWEDKMTKLGKRCQEVVKKCNADWRDYAEKVIDQTYSKYAGSSNAEMASYLFKDLSTNIPQRAWAVFVYNDVYGFGPHTCSYAQSQVFQKWHKNNKCVTVDSTDIGSRFNTKEATDAMLKSVGEVHDCKKMERGDPAKRLVSRMGNHHKWRGGIYYAIQKGIGLEFRITPNHFAEHYVNKRQDKCSGRTQYNHHMFIFY